MTKYNVGDRVQLIQDYSNALRGDQGAVTAMSNSGEMLELVMNDGKVFNNIFAYRLKPAPFSDLPDLISDARYVIKVEGTMPVGSTDTFFDAFGEFVQKVIDTALAEAKANIASTLSILIDDVTVT